ncbi:DNA-binding protein [Micromonospora olivasterospora]|uniref:DNA-binding protein n=1 Tax=Micromonospora olivasterospora TaxID=1880 RepID=A0A562IKF6_MICOL|nr:DNA-binding protein [Micromonospora olivasterospora]TWH71173.1 hypothetical protein JD77_06203 [Micromonospora olivasterospora]
MTAPEQNLFTAPDAGRARAHRTHAALARITERHAADDTRRRRHAHPYVPDPYEAVALVTALAAGGAEHAPDEEPVDSADLVAALTLVPHVRAEVDALEAGLLRLARDRGLTWQAIAYGLGLGTAQAARQRYERLTGRLGGGADAEQEA